MSIFVVGIASACPAPGSPCSSNADCAADQVCVVDASGGRCAASPASDAGGEVVDAGGVADAGFDLDGGFVDDAGVDVDAGFAPDAGFEDSGTLLRGTLEVGARRLRGDSFELRGRLSPPTASPVLTGEAHTLTPAAPVQAVP